MKFGEVDPLLTFPDGPYLPNTFDDGLQFVLSGFHHKFYEIDP